MATPEQLGLEITTRCDADCRHCLRDSQSRPMADFDVGLLARLVPQCLRMGVRHIGLTGGEAVLHPEFMQIADLLSAMGCTFHLVTNGARHKAVARVADRAGQGLSRVSISIDGAVPSTHDSIRGRGSFEGVLRTISVCVSRGVPINAQMVVMRDNVGEIEALEKLLSGIGVSALSYCHLHPFPGGEDLALTIEERTQVEERVRGLAESSNMHVYLAVGHSTAGEEISCRFLDMRALYADVYGRLCFCCLLSGTKAGTPHEREVVADLNTTPLTEGVARLREAYEAFTSAHAEEARRDALCSEDAFPCLYCARKLGKLDWRRSSPT